MSRQKVILDVAYVNQFKGRVVYIGLEVSKIGGGVVWSVAFLPENMRRVR
jgi:hypothetical protein